MKYRLKTDLKMRPLRPFKHKNGIYYIRIRIAGQDIWRSLKTKKRAEAEELAYQHWYYLQQDLVQNIFELPRVPIWRVRESFEESEKCQFMADSTKRKILVNFEAFCKWLQKRNINTIADITKDVVEIYFNSKKGIKNKTYNNIKSDLKQIFIPVCNTHGIENPFDGIPNKTTSRGDKASDSYRMFSDNEVVNIFSELPKSNMAHKDEWLSACIIAAYTGLRYKDIAFLKWTNVIDDKYIELIPHKTESKVNKSVYINICDELRKHLNQIQKTSFYVIPNLKNHYDSQSATKPFSRFLRKLKINSINGQIAGFHSFRTTVITKSKKAGIDLKDFGGVVGHTSLGMTERYNKAAENITMEHLRYG